MRAATTEAAEVHMRLFVVPFAVAISACSLYQGNPSFNRVDRPDAGDSQNDGGHHHGRDSGSPNDVGSSFVTDGSDYSPDAYSLDAGVVYGIDGSAYTFDAATFDGGSH
jgi:hypothetical protein